MGPGPVLDPRCFMCFKEIPNRTGVDDVEDDAAAAVPECTTTNNNSNNSMANLFIKLLTRYLKVEQPGGVHRDHGVGGGGAPAPGGASSPLVGPIGDEAVVSSVLPLCIGCGAIARKFLELYQLLDFVRLEADAVVREIHGVMVAGEKEEDKKDLVLQCARERVRDESGGGGNGGGGDGDDDLVALSEGLMRLRKQLVDKCCSLGKRTMPRVVLQQLDIKNYSTKMKKDVHLCQTTTTADSCPQEVLPERKSEMNNNFQRDVCNNDDDDDDVDDEEAKVKAMEIKIEYHISEPSMVTAPSWSKPKHKSCHLSSSSSSSASPYFKCNSCDSTFPHQSTLGVHKLWKHRSTFFAQHKHPQLTSEQFEGLIVTLFESIPVPRLRPDAYSCTFCGRDPLSSKGRVQNHWIRHHLEQELVPRLMDLQKRNVLIEPENPTDAAAEGIISFKKLVNGRYECSRCRKTLKTRKTMRIHERSHQGERPLIKCPHCSKTFADRSGVVRHKYYAHRSHFFAQHRDPKKFSPAQFERLVAKLFHSIPVPEEIRSGGGGGPLYRCSFCDCSPMSQKVDVHQHWIRLHKDLLVPKLMELQQSTTVEEIEALLFLDPPPAGKSSSTTVKAKAPTTRSHKAEESFKCPHCDKAFQHPSGVRRHKYWAHRSHFFAQHKDPTKFSSAQFERLVTKLFNRIPVPEIRPGGPYSCSFCDWSPMSRKENVHKHWIRLHKDQLVPKLLELQQSTTVEEIEGDIVVAGEPNPTSVNPAVQKAKDNKITFKKLQDGRYQCSSCGRTLRPLSRWAHRISHVAGDSTFKCHICAKTFVHQSNLEEHKYRNHRSSFFAQHKEPSLAWEQFEGVIDKLFASIEVPKLREGAWQCTFCETISLNVKGRVRSHWIRQHMGELVPRLMELQKNNIRESQNSSSSSSSSPSENGTSANPNLGIRDEDVADPPNSSSGSICENSDLDEAMGAAIIEPTAASEPNLVITNVTSAARQAIVDDNEISFIKELQNESPLTDQMPILLAHGGADGDKPFKCALCVGSSFRSSTTLRAHKLWKHRSAFFAAHKDPRLSSEQFEGAIVALFEEFPVPRIRKEVFQCVFCDCPPMKKTGRVQNHWIQRHMDQLVPRLLELQTKILLAAQQQQQDGQEAQEQKKMMMISFKKLANGRYQCSFCHKSVKNQSGTRFHKASHLAADKSFQCSSCAQCFPLRARLEDHKRSKHRSLFFASHKDPKLTPEQFERLLDKLFNSFHIPEVRNSSGACYKCSFCEIPMSSKGRVQIHWIRTHMDEQLVPRLVELQRQIIRGASSRPAYSPSGRQPAIILQSFQEEHGKQEVVEAMECDLQEGELYYNESRNSCNKIEEARADLAEEADCSGAHEETKFLGNNGGDIMILGI